MKVKWQIGISMIEVLVTVAVLLVVFVAIFRVFGGDINRSRDAQRKSDLRDIKLAFEDYYNDHNTYPPASALSDCGGAALQPYLKEVPCDPQTGSPYIYLPYPGDGDTSGGYRVLSILADSSDQIVAQLGCQAGCGLPEDHPEYANRSKYVYGIAEGVPLVSGGGTGSHLTPTASPTPSVTLDPNYCLTNTCFCCANSAYSSSQDCNVWTPGNNCDMGPFVSATTCYQQTPCEAQ
jgi:type II secretory pathway pseudopilin PulG